MKSISEINLFYKVIRCYILDSQSPTSGLIGDGTVGFIRDTILSAGAMWALSIAYRQIDEDRGRQYELEQSAVKSMRGVLTCFMRQSSRIEKYKQNPSPQHALHAYYDWATGVEMGRLSIPSYESAQHLQLDAVALFLNYLSQMTKSGLEIIFSSAEVAFVQNLVYYIERAYRTPDFGRWGRGSRHNSGNPELSASSVGAVKSALDAINGSNLFGRHGASTSAIYTDSDAYCRNQRTLESLLPRESNSKFTDASLLSTLTYPFFAVNETDIKLTESLERMTNELERSHGYIRFNKDGFGCVLEDRTRAHYRPAELRSFNNIECEWPVFFAFKLLHAHFSSSERDISIYREKFYKHFCFDEATGTESKIPTYYQIAKRDIDAARSGKPVEKTPVFLPNFQWVHAIAIIAQLIDKRIIRTVDLDPLRIYNNARNHRTLLSINERLIQVALVAENTKLRTMLSTFGIESETPHQLEPIVIWPSQELVKVFALMGEEPRLGLSGRPRRPIGVLGSSRVYRIMGRTVVAYPLVFDVSDFYISSDTNSLIDNVWFTLDFLKRYFGSDERPVFVFVLREELCKGNRLDPLLELLMAFRRGVWRDVKIRLGRLQSFVANSRPIHLSFVAGRNDDFSIIGSEGFLYSDENRLQRSSSTGSLYSSNSINECTFHTNEAELKTISATDSGDELKDIYYETTSIITKSRVLIRLSELYGNSFSMGDQLTVGQKLNSILRLFTKKKVTFFLKKYFHLNCVLGLVQRSINCRVLSKIS